MENQKQLEEEVYSFATDKLYEYMQERFNIKIDSCYRLFGDVIVVIKGETDEYDSDYLEFIAKSYYIELVRIIMSGKNKELKTIDNFIKQFEEKMDL